MTNKPLKPFDLKAAQNGAKIVYCQFGVNSSYQGRDDRAHFVGIAKKRIICHSG